MRSSSFWQVEDPQTIRYVGASYVNLAGFGDDFCRHMLQNQVEKER